MTDRSEFERCILANIKFALRDFVAISRQSEIRLKIAADAFVDREEVSERGINMPQSYWDASRTALMEGVRSVAYVESARWFLLGMYKLYKENFPQGIMLNRRFGAYLEKLSN